MFVLSIYVNICQKCLVSDLHQYLFIALKNYVKIYFVLSKVVRFLVFLTRIFLSFNFIEFCFVEIKKNATLKWFLETFKCF